MLDLSCKHFVVFEVLNLIRNEFNETEVRKNKLDIGLSTSKQHVSLSRAGRVRNGMKNVFECNKDCKVTCKFVNAKDRTKIFNFLYEIRFGPANLEGIVLRSGQLVDFHSKKKKLCFSTGEKIKANDKVQEIIAYAESNVDVRIAHIPSLFPGTHLEDYIQLNHGQIIKNFRQRDRFNLETEVRIYKLERKNLDNNPISSYSYFGKYKFPVSYKEQRQACDFCTETSHNEKHCERKQYLAHAKSVQKIKNTSRTTTGVIKFEPKTNDTLHQKERNKRLQDDCVIVL